MPPGSDPAQPQSPRSTPLVFGPLGRFMLGRAAGITGAQLISVAVGWELYERTGDPWSLGLIGVFELAPVLLFMFAAGDVADRFPRRTIALWAHTFFTLNALGLAYVSSARLPIALTYGLLLGVGTARAFGSPAMAAFLPQLLSRSELTRANAWVASSFQLAMIGGPALAGALIALTGGATAAYGVAAACELLFVLLLFTLPSIAPQVQKRSRSLAELLQGFHFIRRSGIFLAAISLDLLAVLLGGAVALLPIFAKDILQVGASGLGWLRAAPALGALMMSLLVTRLPPWRRPGIVLLTSVAAFGLATLVFGLSTSFPLSMLALFLIGAFDAISVVIRMTLEQTLTPDSLRGRVSAINYVFIGCSNELGSFESGATAALWGPVGAVVIGACGTLAVVLAVGWIWPELLRLGPLHELDALDPPEFEGGEAQASPRQSA